MKEQKTKTSVNLVKGRLGQDVEFGVTKQSREEFAKFSIAESKGKETRWYNNISAFDNLMEKMKEARKGDWLEVEIRTDISEKKGKDGKPYENHLAKKISHFPIRSIKGNVVIRTPKVEGKTLESGTKAAEFGLSKATDKSLISVVGYGERMYEEMTDLGKGDFIKIRGHQETKTWPDKETGEEKSREVFYADKISVLARKQEISKENEMGI